MSVPCTAEELRPVTLAGLDDGDRARLAGFCRRAEAEPGATLIREGDVDRVLFLVLDGQARIVRGDVHLAVVGPGGYFGELGMVLGRPRAATVIAAGPLRAARLDHDGYRALAAAHPDLALRLVESLVGGIADRLHEMTTSVGVLLRDRSYPRRAQVEVVIGRDVLQVRTGTPVGAVLPARLDGRLVVGGLVDRGATPASWPITSSCTVEPLTAAHPEGERLLRASTALLLLEAAEQLAPDAGLRLGHSVGLGHRVELAPGQRRALPELAAALQQRMEQLTAAAVPLREEQWTTDEARDHFREHAWEDALALLETWPERTVTMCSYGRVHALATTPLAAHAGLVTGYRVVPDGADGLVLIHPGEAAGARPPAPGEVEAIVAHTRALAGPQERWLRAMGMTCVGTFNRACVRGDVGPIVRVAEGFHERRVTELADRIRDGGAGVVCIAGPSSSGKTTFIHRLRVQLQVVGLEPVEVSLDDYYVDRERTPTDASGNWDFEDPDALQRALLDEHVRELLAGHTVQLPRYDFPSGRSLRDGGPRLALRRNQVLMLEGIHALNPALLPGIPRERRFGVFVCPLAQLPFDRLSRVHASDVRLIRRIVRDRHGRAYAAAETIRRWPSVRAGERRHIFPFQHHADAVVDTSLVYELGVLKVFAERYLLEVPRDDDAWTTAARLLDMLGRFVAIHPDHVPPTSILREFVGSGVRW
jgi:uridine kinase